MSQDCVLVFAVLIQVMNGRLGFHGWQRLGRGMLMNPLHSIAIPLLTAVLLAGCGTSKPPADAEALKAEALKLFKEGKYEAALPIIKAAIQAGEEQKGKPTVDLGDCYSGLGQILSFKDQHKEAIVAYDKATLINIQNKVKGLKLAKPILYSSDCSIKLGDLQDAQARVAKAITAMTEAGDENSFELVSAMVDLAGIQIQKGKGKEAEDFLKAALKAGRSQDDFPPSMHCRILNNLGEIRFLDGDYSEALNYYTKALDLAVEKMPADQRMITQFRKNVENAKAKLGK
jgi:tetratricopeptide (TPR) repeat protein